MRSRIVYGSFVAVALAVAVPNVARADEEPSAADVAAARALGQEGVKLADAGNCAEAIDKLSRAEKIFHAPTTLARLGECQVQMGKIVDGTENLNKVVREQLAPNAPPAFAQAQERAKKVLEAAKPKIAKLKIAVAAPPDAQLHVKVDGEHMPNANLNTNRPIDPGEHTVEASAPGYLTATTKVRLTEGGNDSVALTLEPDPNAPKKTDPAPIVPVTAPPPNPQPDRPPPPPPQEEPSRVPAYAALGVGVVGVGIGTVFGVMASSKKGDLEDRCPNKICTTDPADDIDSGKTLGTVSTVGFIVGGVGLIAGAYLFLTAGPKRTATTKVSPFVGLGSAGVTGRF